MCVGESTTALGGADSYPSRLEAILRERVPEIGFSVLNRGVPGGNTAQILDAMGPVLDRCNPQVVVAMMGANDSGDFVPFTSLRHEGEGGLENLRVYRLYRHLTAASRARTPEASASASPSQDSRPASKLIRKAQMLDRKGDLVEEIAVLEKAMALDPTDWRVPALLGELRMMRFADYGRARPLIEEARRLAPDLAIPYLDLAFVNVGIGRATEAEALFEAASRASWSHLTMRRQYFTSLARYLERHHLDERASAMFASLEREKPAHMGVWGCAAWYWGQRGDLARRDAYRRKLAVKRTFGCLEETWENYRRLHDMLGRRGITLIAVQYPTRTAEPLAKMFASADDVLVVENKDNFREAIDEGRFHDLFTDNCYGDIGHCTRLGNTMIARSVANAIVRRWFSHAAESPQPGPSEATGVR